MRCARGIREYRSSLCPIPGREAELKSTRFLKNWEKYAKTPEYKKQIAALRGLEKRGLIEWSAILGDPKRVRQLNAVIAKNRGASITAGNRGLKGTPFAQKFAAAEPFPRLPGSTPLSPNNLQPLPGFLRQTDTFQLPGFSAAPAVPPMPGFTPSNPLLKVPGFASPHAGFAGPQTLARSPARIVSDDFARVREAKLLNGTLPAEREPAMGSGDAILAVIPLIMAAAPEEAAAAVGVGVRYLLERAASAGLGAAVRANLPAMLTRAMASASGVLAAARPAPATQAPATVLTPNQMVADDFQSLKGGPASSSSWSTLLRRSKPDSNPFAWRAASSVSPTAYESRKEALENQPDETHGGPGRGRVPQQFPATLIRAAQLAGLPDGGFVLGQRTSFAPPVVRDFGRLPAVLHEINKDSGDGSAGPNNQTRTHVPLRPATDESSNANLGSQRRVSSLADPINGGRELNVQIPAALNRASELAGLSGGGITHGQRTWFPPVVNTDFSHLPAVLRRFNIGAGVNEPAAEMHAELSSTMPATNAAGTEDPVNRRRVSGLSDPINGGAGRPIQGPAVRNLTTRLTSLRDGGITIGQRTSFPPLKMAADLPALLRGIDQASSADFGHAANQRLWGYLRRRTGRQAPLDRY